MIRAAAVLPLPPHAFTAVHTLLFVRARPLAAPLPRLWRYYKPAGLLTTHKDPEGRPTVFDSLPPSLPRVVSVGRLDMQTEGLLLLTDSGQFARMLELPDAKIERLYEVQLVTGSRGIDQQMLHEIEAGIVFADGTRLRKIDVRVVSQGERRATLTMRLREGKKREVRRIWEEHFGFRVRKLQRRAYGPFQIGLLDPGELKEVPPEEVRKMQAIARINLYRTKGDAQGKTNLPKHARRRKLGQEPATAQADQAEQGDGADEAWEHAGAGEREPPERRHAAAPAAN
eukprot:6013926-Pleurochrysis_carterae.AAC.3